jgi:hypothetical protein
MSDVFPIQNRLEQGNTLLTLLFNSALQYTINKMQENWE